MNALVVHLVFEAVSVEKAPRENRAKNPPFASEQKTTTIFLEKFIFLSNVLDRLNR